MEVEAITEDKENVCQNPTKQDSAAEDLLRETGSPEPLTEEELAAIKQRTLDMQAQFKRLAERDHKNKVLEVQDICQFSYEEAEYALALCEDRTDQAATRLVEDPDFARQVKAACRKVVPQAATKTLRRKIGSKATASEVFCGSFRGRGMGALPAAAPPSTAALPAQAGSAGPQAAGAAAAAVAAAAAAAAAADGDGAAPSGSEPESRVPKRPRTTKHRPHSPSAPCTDGSEGQEPEAAAKPESATLKATQAAQEPAAAPQAPPQAEPMSPSRRSTRVRKPGPRSPILLMDEDTETETDDAGPSHAPTRSPKGKGKVAKKARTQAPLRAPASSTQAPAVSAQDAAMVPISHEARQPSGDAGGLEGSQAPAAEQAASAEGEQHRPAASNRAISASGHTNRGRVKQKSTKRARIVALGSLRVAKGWYDSGYIFPEGYVSQLAFRSSVELDQTCVHVCSIIGQGGQFWPAPTFKITALDREDAPLFGKSCTACWTQILKRINSEIERRRKAGEDLPPAPKTAIAGPEYFGLCQPDFVEQLDMLDPDRECTTYWQGKAVRDQAIAGLPLAGPSSGPRPPRGSGPSRKKRTRGGESSDEEEGAGEPDGDSFKASKWASLSRAERYRARSGQAGEVEEDPSNPLPHMQDRITCAPMTNPAISIYGHVLNHGTWKAMMADSTSCPFTKQPLNLGQITVLNINNIDRFRDRIRED